MMLRWLLWLYGGGGGGDDTVVVVVKDVVWCS